MRIAHRLTKVEQRTRELTLPWKIFPGEALLDELEKGRRVRDLPIQLWLWCVDQFECAANVELGKRTLHFWEGDERYRERRDIFRAAEKYLETVVSLILAYQWGPASISQEARHHLERIHAHQGPGSLPEDLEFSDMLEGYLATDPKARFNAFVRLRTHHRSTLLRIAKFIAALGDQRRRVCAPEAQDRIPNPDRILRFGDLKPARRGRRKKQKTKPTLQIDWDRLARGPSLHPDGQPYDAG